MRIGHRIERLSGLRKPDKTKADVHSRLRLYLKGAEDVASRDNRHEGFLFRGRDAERTYHETGRFDFISTGGYYHSLPGDSLRQFIDTAAEVEVHAKFAELKLAQAERCPRRSAPTGACGKAASSAYPRGHEHG